MSEIDDIRSAVLSGAPGDEVGALPLPSTFRAAVGTNDYNTRQPLDAMRTKWRHDSLAGGTLGLEYAIQPWLRTGLDYAFQSRASNFRPFNYEDSKISGRITLQF